jgi:hypothetical protein
MILTSKSEEVAALFEALGFERRHKKKDISDTDVTNIAMKNADGFVVSITQMDQIPQDMTAVSMNVDHFEEAMKLLEAHGFRNVQGEKSTDTGSSVATMLFAPSGFPITVSEHIKK